MREEVRLSTFEAEKAKADAEELQTRIECLKQDHNEVLKRIGEDFALMKASSDEQIAALQEQIQHLLIRDGQGMTNCN